MLKPEYWEDDEKWAAWKEDYAKTKVQKEEPLLKQGVISIPKKI